MTERSGTGDLLTIEEFERLPDDGFRSELVRGRIVREPPAGMVHGEIGNRLAFLVPEFVRSHALGKVYSADTGFVLFEDPPTVVDRLWTARPRSRRRGPLPL